MHHPIARSKQLKYQPPGARLAWSEGIILMVVQALACRVPLGAVDPPCEAVDPAAVGL